MHYCSRVLFEYFYQPSATDANGIIQLMVPLGVVFTLISMVEFLLLTQLNKFDEPQPSMTFNVVKLIRLGYFRENQTLIFSYRNLIFPILALSLVWGISQTIIAVFAAHLKNEFNVTNTIIAQATIAIAAIGIILGSVMINQIIQKLQRKSQRKSQRQSKTKSNSSANLMVLCGSVLMCVCLMIVHVAWSIWIIGVVFFMYGVAVAAIMVPLTSQIQLCVDQSNLGRVLAGNNLYQNIGMFSFLALSSLMAWLGMSYFAIYYLLIVASIVLFVLILTKIYLKRSTTPF